MNPTQILARGILLNIFLLSAVHAQYTFTPATPAAIEDFNGMGVDAVATLPANWRVSNPSSDRTVSSFHLAGTATTARAGNGMATNAGHGIYNYGAGVATSATDRAIGGLSSSSASYSVNAYTWIRNAGTVDIASLSVAYSVEKYRNGSNPSGFRIQLFYSSDGVNWTNAGSNFLTSFGADADNTGFTTAPGSTTPVSATLNVPIPVGDTLYLAWNYSVSSGSTRTNAQGLAVDDVNITANFVTIDLADNTPQTGAGTVNVGAANQDLYRFQVQATNGSVRLDSLRVPTTGTYTSGDIDQFSLLTALVNDKSLATPVGGTVSGGVSGQSLLFLPNQSQAAGSTRYYWLVADIAAGGTLGNTVGVGIPDVYFAQGSSLNTLTSSGLQTLANLTPSVVLATQNPSTPGGNLAENDTLTPVYRLQVDVSNAPVTLNQLDFTTQGSYSAAELSGLSLYRSTESAFNPATSQQVAYLNNPGVAGAKSFTGLNTVFATGSSIYIYIVAHVACSSASGSTVSVDPISTSDLTFAESVTTGGAGEVGGVYAIIRPAVQVNQVVATPSVSAASIDWLNPACFDQVLVVMRAHQAVGFTPSGDGSSYAGNTVWAAGTDLGNGEYVIYSGSGNAVSVSQLIDGASYSGAIYTRRGLDWSGGVVFSVQPDSATTNNFSTDANWFAGSGGLGSYQVNHIFQGNGFSISGGPALRELASTGDGTVDGVPRTFNGSPYAWRTQNDPSVNWVITVPSGGIGKFSITLRRWTGGVNLALEYSDDNGQSWSPLDTITAQRLNNSSQWSTITHTLNNSRDSLRLRLRALGATERVMIGAFSFTSGVTTWDGFGWSRGVPNASQDIRVLQNRNVSEDISCRNVFLENGTFQVPSGQVLNVAGGIQGNGGEIDVTAGVLRMSGAAAQVLPASALQGAAIAQLEINNPTGVTLSGDISITDSLALQSGFLSIGSSQLTLSGGVGGGGTLSGSPTSNLRINGNGAFGPLSFTAGARSLGSFEVNRNGTTTLGSFLDVHSSLSLQNGLLQLGSHNLTVLDAGGLSGGDTATYIVTDGAGALRRTIGGAAAYTFPMGTLTHYNPATVSWAGTPGVTRLDARFISGPPSNSTGLTVLVDSIEVNTLLDGGYWSIQAVGTVEDPYQISLTSNGHTNADVVRRNHAIVKRSTPSSAWEAAGKWSAPAGDSLMQATDLISLVQTQIPSFSDFSIGSGDPIPLPVQLLFFDARLSGASVQLTWETAGEINNSHFEAQRSADLQNFETLGEVAGNGTSSQLHRYAFTDSRPVSGLNYYRLRQVDFDGTHTFSTLAAVQVGSSGIPGFRAFPQPCKELCYIESGDWHNAPLQLTWTAMDGREQAHKVLVPGALHLLSNLDLPFGVYLLRIQRLDNGELSWMRWVAY